MDAPQLLSTAGRIGELALKNRLLMAHMVRNYANGQGRMTPCYLAHLQHIACGGMAAMILEAGFVGRRRFLDEVISAIRKRCAFCLRETSGSVPDYFPAQKTKSTRLLTAAASAGRAPLPRLRFSSSSRPRLISGIQIVSSDFCPTACSL